MTTEFVDVLAEAELPLGSLRRVHVAGEPVALLHGDAGFAAFDDTCPHAGAPLSEGVLREGYIVCSWHGWRFDARTGVCPLFAGAPSATVREVRVEAGRVLVRR